MIPIDASCVRRGSRAIHDASLHIITIIETKLHQIPLLSIHIRSKREFQRTQFPSERFVLRIHRKRANLAIGLTVPASRELRVVRRCIGDGTPAASVSPGLPGLGAATIRGDVGAGPAWAGEAC